MTKATGEDTRTLEILLVEDAPGDVRLASEALKLLPIENRIHVAADGQEALNYLRQRESYAGESLPDLVLLDLNLPRVNGHEVLQKMKNDPRLKHIPVVVLTSSKNEEDVLKAYDAYANCYVTKPTDWSEYSSAIQSIGDFWFNFVKLPSTS